MAILPLFIILIFLIITLARSVRVIKQYEKGLVIRLGKYSHTVGPGLAFLIPFIENLILVDMREKVINVQPQKVITKDNVLVIVDGVIYYRVIDPVKAEFEVQDFGLAATTLAQTSLRNIIGDKTLDVTLVARDAINTALRDVLDEATNAWGVKITRVELQKIDPPKDITDAMSKQMKAEREKRAMILEAEGVRQSQILQAEGEKQSRILQAQGEAQAIQLKAQAQAQAIAQVAQAAETHFKDKAALYRQFEVLEKTLKGSTKYVIPTSSKILNILGLDDIVKEKGRK